MSGRRLIAILVLGLSLPLSSSAGSNLGPEGYPGPTCGEKPNAPVQPEAFENQAQLEAYNEAVEAFNNGMEQYISCVQSYVNNAAHDIADIKRKVKAAIADANE